MKVDFLADTNFLIYLHEGNKITTPFLKFDFGISFISEVELLGYKGITKVEEIRLKSLIDDCLVIEWNSKTKEKTIQLRKNYTLRLPDAIVATSAVSFGVPLVTADKAFSKVKELDLILIEL
jgi:predicted nucleic acid-binding protein